jgi:hypothetical protein
MKERWGLVDQEVIPVLWILLLLPAALLVCLPLMAGLERFTDQVKPARRDSDDP